jgi:hypothetical protein
MIEFPKFFELKAKDLIRKLLNPDINLRLGVSDVNINKYINSKENHAKSINGLGALIGMQLKQNKFLHHGLLI